MPKDYDKIIPGGIDKDNSYRDVEGARVLSAMNVRLNSEQQNTKKAYVNVEGNQLVPVDTDVYDFSAFGGTYFYVGKIVNELTESVFMFFKHTHGSVDYLVILRYFTAQNTWALILKTASIEVPGDSNWLLDGDLISNKYLYFNIPTSGQYKINIDKVNEDKQVEIKVYFTWYYEQAVRGGTVKAVTASYKQAFFNGETYQLTDGVTIVSHTSTGLGFTAELNAFIAAFNASALGASMTASNGGDHMLITGDTNGYFNIYPQVERSDMMVVYQNMYYKEGGDYRVEYFRLIKPLHRFPVSFEPRIGDLTSGTDLLFSDGYSQAEPGYAQISCRYLFDDGEKSRFSDWSVTKIPALLYSTYKSVLLDSSLPVPTYFFYAFIMEDFTEQWLFSMVKEVEIAIKYGDDATPLTLKYLKYSDISAGDMIPFRNIEATVGLDEAAINETSDAVPLLSNSMSIADNRVFLGGNTEGFEKEDIDVDIVVDMVTNYSTIAPTTGNRLLQILGTPDSALFGFPAGTPVNIGTYLQEPSSRTLRFWKRGSYRKLGVVFYDRYNRNMGVYTNNDMYVYVPEQFEAAADSLPAATANTLALTSTEFKESFAEVYGTINGTPPEWATHYQWVVTENLTFSYFDSFRDLGRSIIREINPDGTFVTGAIGDENARARIIIQGEATRVQYQFQEGDLVRAYKIDLSVSPAVIYPSDKYYEIYQQSGYDIIVDIAIFDFFFASPAVPIGGPRSVVYEIVRPKRGDNNVFYGTGTYGAITNPGTPSRSYGSLFTGDGQLIDGGDCYLGKRTFNDSVGGAFWTYGILSPLRYQSDGPRDARDDGNTHNWLMETQYTDPGDVQFWYGKGRATTEVPQDGEILNTTQVKYGLTYIEGSAQNGLSTFPALNERTFPVEWGELSKIQKVKENLMLFFENEVVSIYLGRTETKNTDGSGNLIAIDGVLGSYNLLTGGFGCLKEHAKSIIERNSNVFWWSQREGVVARYASSGVVPISEVGMASYFNDRSMVTCIGGLNMFKDYAEYLFTFDDGTDQETWMYDNENERWVSQMSYVPNDYIYINNKFFTIRDSGLSDTNWLYVHNVYSGGRNTFYGTKTNPKVVILSNRLFRTPKVWHNISLESKDVWITTVGGIQTIGDHIDETQISELIAQDFESKEGTHYAWFLRAKNTPNVISEAEGLINGEVLRSKAIIIELECDTDEFTILYNVNVGFIFSSGHTS